MRFRKKPNVKFVKWPKNEMGANSTRPHERDREAPMREARQAAPDGARASAALSFGGNSRFSRETEPLRRKVVMSFCYVISVGKYNYSASISMARQHRQHSLRTKWDLCATNLLLVQFRFSRKATDSRDENLRAKSPAAAGESEEERKRERLSVATRSILDAPAAATESKRFSSRCPMQAEWLAKRRAFSRTIERRTLP